MHVLSIGIDEYKNTGSLQNCISDAISFARGFEFHGDKEAHKKACVILETNIQTKKDFRGLFRRTLRPRIEASRAIVRAVIVYVACHAVQVKSEIYLIPCTADLTEEEDISDQCYELSALIAEIKQAVDG